MLYVQETKSANSTRVFKVETLPQALDALVKIFVEIKFTKDKHDEAVFDLQELLEYYEQEYDIKYFQELPNSPEGQQSVTGFQVKNVRAYNGKMLLDELVDYLASSSAANPQANSQ